MKRQGIKKGFTIIELLTSITIIAILIGTLIPALRLARNTAKKASQKAQFASISQAIMTFKNDMGYYPPSALEPPESDYCGAQKLAEALLGWDLLGFHPDSNWKAMGEKVNGGAYDGLDPYNLDNRVGPYLDSGSNAFTLKQLYGDTSTYLPENRFVICDSFGRKKVTLDPADNPMTPVRAGTPILYYKADITKKLFTAGNPYLMIYNINDNYPLLIVRRDIAGITEQLIDNNGLYFYDANYKIMNPKITVRDWPHNPDSYILISAGVDGLYGTQDDITNF